MVIFHECFSKRHFFRADNFSISAKLPDFLVSLNNIYIVVQQMVNVKKSSAACLIFLKEESDIDDGSKVPETIQIPEKCNIIIGRGAPGLDVTVALSVLENGSHIISRQHATILCTPNQDCIIKDLMSQNGVFVNNIKIEEHTLVDG